MAIYSWAPLVAGWIGTDEPAAVSADGEPGEEIDLIASPGSPTSSESSPLRQELPEYRWTQLDEWMNRDPATRAADLSAFGDPFHSARVAVTDEELAAASALAELAISPDHLGVELAGTLLGSKRRVALINGRAYREGERVELGPADQRVEFELTRVGRRSIVLGRNDRQFELAIPQRKHPGRLKLTSNSN